MRLEKNTFLTIIWLGLILRSKYFKVNNFLIVYIIFILIITQSIPYHRSGEKELMKLHKHDFFSHESIKLCSVFSHIELSCLFKLKALSTLKVHKYRKYFQILLLLSGNIELNPGPEQTIYDDPQLDCFKEKGLHFLHLNCNSVLPKIEEISKIALKSNAAVIGITESKLNDSVFDSEVKIEGYEIERADRNRRGGGGACYIRKNISYNRIEPFSQDVENVFLEILLPKTKPFIVGIFYRPPDQYSFLEKISVDFEKLNSLNREIYILGDINIDLLSKGKYVFDQKNSLFDDVNVNTLFKKYKEFCSSFGLVQLIKVATRITSESSTLIDHILTNMSGKISQSGVIDIGVSNHNLVFCTRKLKKQKFNSHKTVLVRSMKNYSKEGFNNALQNITFPNYETFLCVDKAYNDFQAKFLSIIDTFCPSKETRIKNSSSEWFDVEIAEKINLRDKLFKKFKKSRLHIDKEIFNNARNDVTKTIKLKKRNFFSQKLEENIAKPKELWKTLKKIGLPDKKSKSPSSICLQDGDNISFDNKRNCEIFKDFYSNLASNLLQKLPLPTKKFCIESVKKYYHTLTRGKSFDFQESNEEYLTKLLEAVDSTKTPGIDNISGVFLKDGAHSIAKPLSQILNLSIKLSTFPSLCKATKIKPIFKKGSKTEPKNYRPIKDATDFKNFRKKQYTTNSALKIPNSIMTL